MSIAGVLRRTMNDSSFSGTRYLELVVTENLFHGYDRPEGEMTAWRAALVNGDMLASYRDKNLGVEDFLSDESW
jgi:dsRNA-specific ribonuclease